jgi:hypothetical protein
MQGGGRPGGDVMKAYRISFTTDPGHRAGGFSGGQMKLFRGASFSVKRAIGLSRSKARVSRGAGVPLTRQSRQRKGGRAIGCCIVAAFLLTGITAATLGIMHLTA